ncbi:MAG: tryptophan 7-halogenase, partial [Anaerolineales bacterium]|nr:tryptophan 7-halogenase [Anaerolineales bacterium]
MGREGEDYDLIVVGGGPAGASVATFVAMRGHRVLLLEADHFPRYHIGESLIPATI